MNKKGVAILSLSAIGLLIAVMIFYGQVQKLPGNQERFLGELEVDIFNTYINAEKELLYMDIIAEYAWGDAGASIEGTEENINEKLLTNFKENFGKKLKGFNKAYNRDLKIEDYKFKFDGASITGVTEKELNFTTERIDYKFKPNFRYPYAKGKLSNLYDPEIMKEISPLPP